MCHGMFDIVHPGHIRHLLYAKSKADILVASLTADRAYRQRRTSGRYVPQDLRAINLAAFEIVDYVIIDSEPTPLQQSRAASSRTIFAKGYEYQASGLPSEDPGGARRDPRATAARSSSRRATSSIPLRRSIEAAPPRHRASKS